MAGGGGVAAGVCGGKNWQDCIGGNSSSLPPNLLACDIGRGCTLPNGAVLRFTPAASLKTPFDIALSGSGAEKAVSVSFSMRDMDMGFNRYDLHRQADGGWLAQNVRLPLCTEARHDFLADVSVDGQVYRVPFTAY